MSRTRMVTRTVSITTVTAMTVKVSESKLNTKEYSIIGKFTDNDEVLKALKKSLETDDFKIITIAGTETNEVLYGMPESEFIKIAKELPNR